MRINLEERPTPPQNPKPKAFSFRLRICPLSPTTLSRLLPFSLISVLGLLDHTSSLGIMASEDEDDYMNMVIEEPTQKETFTQKKRRELREVPYPPHSNLNAHI